jgi:hypothetical protein
VNGLLAALKMPVIALFSLLAIVVNALSLFRSLVVKTMAEPAGRAARG